MHPCNSLRDGMCRRGLNAKMLACSHTLSDNCIALSTCLKLHRILLLELVYYLRELVEGHTMQVRVY